MSVYVIFNNIPSASGGFAPKPPPGLRPWSPLGDFRPPNPLVALLVKIPAGAHGAPTFFSEQDPVGGKSGPEEDSLKRYVALSNFQPYLLILIYLPGLQTNRS